VVGTWKRGQEPIRIQMQPPFTVPPERRDPARRLRGRLVAPVTVWTAGQLPGGAGLTVSSILVAEGQPARLLGLIDPTSAFWEATQETGAFVVNVLAVGDRALAERFSEVRPPIRGPFDGLQVAESPWGPVLGGSRPRAACRLAGSAPVGHGELVEGVIERLALLDPGGPRWSTCMEATGRWVISPTTAEVVAPFACPRASDELAEAVGRELAELDLPAR
jgi:3-hydroxy-9,10-secoandrosta-1,3,5(10)-triene-9,17-dione monooxygenase reductase component